MKESNQMTALSAFELLLKCVQARKAYSIPKGGAYARQVAEKDDALDAVINALAGQIRYILTPDATEDQPK